MSVTEIPARDWTFELNTGTVAAPTWVEVGGIVSFSHSESATRADTTVNSDDGVPTHYKSSATQQWTLTGRKAEDTADGSRDAGQEAVESWALERGLSSVKQFRMTSPGGTTRTVMATADVTLGGGGNDDPDAWGATIHESGAATTA